MEAFLIGSGIASLLVWLYLTFFHGRFWRADQRLVDDAPFSEGSAEGSTEGSTEWPAVVAVVPARNEADVIELSLSSLLDQDYPGSWSVVLVDDHSDDGSGDRAAALASRHIKGAALTSVTAEPLPPGWTGKMWAVHQGVEAASRLTPEAKYWLLTDADVEHDAHNLRRLVVKAEVESRDLVSLMVRLHCRGGWERLLIPAFVYFFQQLYPFPRVNHPGSRTAGAAGGCMLVRRDALERAGGIEAIRGEVIDDCALGRRLKWGGSIWLGLTETVHSIRPYEGVRDIWNMVARTAYTQLGDSPLLLAGTLVGLVLVYGVPPLLTLGWSFHGSLLAGTLGAASWLLMAGTFVPTLRLYGCSGFRGFALPVAGLLYLGMTFDSALRTWRGQGAKWKGRSAVQPR